MADFQRLEERKLGSLEDAGARNLHFLVINLGEGPIAKVCWSVAPLTQVDTGTDSTDTRTEGTGTGTGTVLALRLMVLTVLTLVH